MTDEISKEDAAKLYKTLAVKSKKFSGTKRPSVDVMECVRPSGRVVHFIAIGHHDFSDFAYACKYRYAAIPHQMSHTHHREVWRIPKEGSNGKKYCTTELCKKGDRESKPITIGYP